MSQQQSSQWFQKIRRFFAYLVTPLMVAAVGWLSNQIGDKINYNSHSSGLNITFFLILLVFAFLLFCIVVITNLNERDPANPQNIQIRNTLIMRITLFFVMTFSTATSVSLFGNFIEDWANQNESGTSWLWISFVTTIVCWFIDVTTNPSKMNKLRLGSRHVIFLLLILVFFGSFVLGSCWYNNEQNEVLKASLLVPTIYLVYLFFQITRLFVKPYNKMTEEKHLSRAKHLMLFLSFVDTGLNEDETTQKIIDSDNYKNKYEKLIALMREENDHVDNMNQTKKAINELEKQIMKWHPQSEPAPSNQESSEDQWQTLKKQMLQLNELRASQPVLDNDALSILAFFKARCDQNVLQKHAISSLQQLCDELDKVTTFHPWEQSLRAIAKHLDARPLNLEEITLFVSKGSTVKPGSVVTYPIFMECLKLYLGTQTNLTAVKLNVAHQKIEINKGDERYVLKTLNINDNTIASLDLNNNHGIDFGSYQDVNEALDTILLKDEVKSIGYKNIVVDVTGGQKPTSAAGVLAATVLDVMNQYVDTNDKKQVKGYDFQYVDPTKSA